MGPRVRLKVSRMQKNKSLTGLVAFLVLAATPLAANPNQDDDDSSLNVNTRYTIESISVTPEKRSAKLSGPLHKEIDQMVGQNLDHSLLEKLADKIKEELEIGNVNIRVSKSQMPERVVVTFDTDEGDSNIDMNIGRFLYHSKQGWTGEGTLTYRHFSNAVSFGLVSDGDRLAERYAGIHAGFERRKLGTERIKLRFRFQSYHQQWNRATLLAADPDQIYRTRQHFIPEATISLAAPLDWTFGTDFARYRIAIPNPVAPASERTESSNAVVTTLRYHQRWGSASGPAQQELTATYGLRSATGFLESDAIFTRQLGDVQYKYKGRHNVLKLGFQTGRISGGSAPLYERFILGNAETLRGWNKFDLQPLGASRVVHGSIDYSMHGFLVFYDTGALWDLSKDREQKQSLGVGFSDGGFELAVAFPIRTGSANPVFYVGLNF